MKVQDDVLQEIVSKLCSTDVEQGFLLGSISSLDIIDCCAYLPSKRSSKCFYEPDTFYANNIIQEWASEDICFSGFLHSHIIEKDDLSVGDIEYAKQICTAYNLPYLWFGLVTCSIHRLCFHIYKIKKMNLEIKEVQRYLFTDFCSTKFS